MDFEGYAHTSFFFLFSFKFPFEKFPLKFCFRTFSASSLHPRHLPCAVFQPFSSALPANLSPGSKGNVTLGWLLLLPAVTFGNQTAQGKHREIRNGLEHSFYLLQVGSIKLSLNSAGSCGCSWKSWSCLPVGRGLTLWLHPSRGEWELFGFFLE